MKTLSAVVLSVLMMQSQGTSGLSQQEKALAAYVDAHSAEAITLLERAVNINSGSLNLDGVRQVGHFGSSCESDSP